MNYKFPSKFKLILFKALSPHSEETKWYYKIDDFFISTLIVLNVVAIMLESFDTIHNLYKSYFRIFELFSIIIFTAEYFARIYIANVEYIGSAKDSESINDEDYILKKQAYKHRVKYIFSFVGLIDLFAILPFYLPFVMKMDLRLLRILRLLRLFRIFKLAHYSSSLRLVGNVFKDKKEELIITLFATLILLILTSSIMYNVEHTVQPDKFPNIFATLWWAVATFTTIGYGDVFPVTGWGKLLAAFTALFGIGLVAIPTGIISAGFLEEIQNKKEDKNKKSNDNSSYNYCPYCGEKLNKKQNHS